MVMLILPHQCRAPTAATLNTPAKNSECLDGENVEFKWAASDNTDSYDIAVKNLLTQSQITQTTTSTTVTIKLDKRTTIFMVYHIKIK